MMNASAPSAVWTPPSLVLLGFNDAGCLGSGWHDLERDGRIGVAYRATHREATLRVGVAPGTRSLGILLSGSPSLLGKPMTGRIEWAWDSTTASLDGEWHPLEELALSLETDIWVVRILALPNAPDRPKAPAALIVRFRTDEPALPDKVLRNGDARELGFYVSAIWGR